MTLPTCSLKRGWPTCIAARGWNSGWRHRAVAGYTDIGLAADPAHKRVLRDAGIVQTPEDLGIDRRRANRQMLAAKSIRDLVEWSGGLYNLLLDSVTGKGIANGSTSNITSFQRQKSDRPSLPQTVHCGIVLRRSGSVAGTQSPGRRNRHQYLYAGHRVRRYLGKSSPPVFSITVRWAI